MINNAIWTIFLSMLPVTEVRLSIPYGISSGLNVWLVLFLSLLGNLSIAPLIFLFLDYLHKHFMRIRYYEKMFNLYANFIVKKFHEKREKTWPYLAFFAFIALPLPGTGTYTGVLLAWLIGMKRVKAYLSVIFGVIVDAVIVTLITLGVIKIF